MGGTRAPNYNHGDGTVEVGHTARPRVAAGRPASMAASVAFAGFARLSRSARLAARTRDANGTAAV